MTSIATPRTELRTAALTLAVAAIAVAASAVVPLLGPLLLALAAGAMVANSPVAGVVADHARVTKLLLRCGVVLLGLRIAGADLVAVGPEGAVVVVATVVCTYVATQRLGRRLGLDRDLVTLIAAGFSICGAAAVAAVNDAVRARERDVGVAVALVTLFGSAMIALVPVLGRTLGLTERQTAVWAGASIHEVAQVAAAASLVGTGAVALAMTVKLGRVLLLAPVYVAASRGGDTPGLHRAVPWFVVGFALAVAVRSTGLLPTGVVEVSQDLATLLLAAGMFGLGLGIRARDLRQVPRTALLLATASTCVAAGVSLTLVAALVR
ncbi:YeiH family protein [Aeromicrobium sp. Leaf291]|uniref:YeiH family protein n=1 Tax=Aeromicrobium sp. Leaf291 TaxID=1736325 RepID=UPI000700B2CB|nr:putative sulfate exporter family transporter [Aeromicrobium sp. Leaf291]KQP83565.1 hypothetical protein ASF35_00805 [Aeromicrobium sp. Leaf291]